MSQLVSARLLVGAGSFSRSGSTAAAAQLTRGRRLFATTTSSRQNRSLQAGFFAPSYDWRRSQTVQHRTVSAALVPAVEQQQHRAVRSAPGGGSLLGHVFGVSRRSQQHLAAASAYAPPSDDPEVTTRRNHRHEAAQADGVVLPLSPQEALTAGYRPVPALTMATLPRIYRQLAKAQLTFLVTLTAMSGYALCPSALAVSTSVTTLLSMTLGTALCSASANALNQLVESPYDAQMPRTRNRPLPSRAVSPLHAATFASLAGAAGVGALATINPLTAALGLANIVLYSGVYTPMKRVSIVNTWVGSVVGGIPPLIGWTACTGTLHLASDMPGWTLAALLFAWQFPHFNSLAHTLRREYARGGYRMMSVSDPSLNRRTSLRYAITLLPICSVLLPWTGVVHWTYAVLSAPINAAMVYAAYGFWRRDGDKPARQCFWVSLLHLPAVLLLAMACKTDVVQGIQRRLGWLDDEEEENIDDGHASVVSHITSARS